MYCSILFCFLWLGHSLDKATARQYPPDVLSDLSGSDAVDYWVKTAGKQWVHGAEENPNGCRETISDPKRQESSQYNDKTHTDDHNVGDTRVKSFDTWYSWS